MKKRKVSALVLAAIVAFSGVPFPGNVVNAETVPNYNVGAAVNYAKQHYNDKETITTPGKQDCTQFVRECLEAGGVPKDTNRVNNGVPYGYDVDMYVEYLMENGYADKTELRVEKQDWDTPQWYVRETDNSKYFVKGDPVLYHCNVCDNDFHMALNTGTNADGFVTIHAQNKPVNGEPLCKIDCPNGHREDTTLYAIHMKTNANGYSTKYNNTTVANISIKRVDADNITVKWDAATGAKGYKIFKKNGKNSAFEFVKTQSGTTYNFKENNGADVYFAVRPYFEDGGKTYVGKLSKDVWNNEELQAPVLKITKKADGSAQLSWNKVPGGFTYFELYRADSKDGTYTKISNNSLTGTTYTTSQITKWYKVRAVRETAPANKSAFSNSVSLNNSGNLKLDTPTAVKAELVSGKLNLSWNKVTGADSYKILRSKFKDGTYEKVAEITGNTYKTSNKQYFYKIQACSKTASGSNSQLSAPAYVARRIESIKFNAKGYGFTGKKVKPTPYIYDNYGNKVLSEYCTITYPENSLLPGKYTVKVTAKDGTVYSGSKSASFEIKAAKITKISTALYGHDDVKVSWRKSSRASSYYVYYKKATSEKWSVAKVKKSRTYYKKSNLSDGQEYVFMVIPYTASKYCTSSAAPKTSKITTLKKLGVPTVEKYSATQVKVSWDNIDGETGYQISQSTKKSKTKIVSTYKTTSRDYKTVKAKKGRTYYYKVRAYKQVGSKKIYAPWSTVKSYKLQ